MFWIVPSHAGAALFQTRLLWAGSLIGQVIVTAALLVLCADFQSPWSASNWLPITVATALTVPPTALFFRNQIYKLHWQGHAVTPKGFFLGNLFLQGSLESVTLLVVITGVFCGALFPSLIAGGLVMALQLVNFPNGRMMLPRKPDMADSNIGA